jgi:hypothetical protein
MLNKMKFWLAGLAISTIALPAWSLPKTMIMDMTMNVSQGARPVKADAKIYYANQKFRAEISSNLDMSQQSSTPIKVSNKAVFLMDINQKIAYMIDSKSKTALKVDQAQVEKLTGQSSANAPETFTNPAMLTNPAKIQEELKKQGAKVIGKTKMLGHPVTIYQMTKTASVPVGQGKSESQSITTKLWLADDLGLPMKMEAVGSKSGKLASLDVKKVVVNVPVSAAMFKVPSGYQIRNLMDMYKN